jgi:hypothetical protein
MTYIALRKDHATNANFVQKVFSALIKERTVSDYCHSGVVVGDKLYHVTGTKGYQVLEAHEWNPSNWTLLPVDVPEQEVIDRFYEVSKEPNQLFKKYIFGLTKGYDFFSLLAFVGIKSRVSYLNYCYELSWFMVTGLIPTTRITVEKLYAYAMVKLLSKKE